MFTLPELPYSYNALEPYIDEATVRLHHDIHHGAYVNNLNKLLENLPKFQNLEIEELIKSLDQIPAEIAQKVRNNAGGHYNHSLLWTMMSEKSGEPTGQLKDLINSTFGDLNSFQQQITQSALGVFGSGWAWLVLIDRKLSIITSPNQDSPLTDSKIPILGVDVWEHAYYLKYQNRRAEYLENWWKIINWQEVQKRLDANW